MSIYDVLKEAVEKRRCVEIVAAGLQREVAPLAIGFKDSRRKVLTFQFKGGSSSGLAPGGAWRCFFLDDITVARIIDEPWHSGHYPVAKLEASFDYILCGLGARVATFEHKRRR